MPGFVMGFGVFGYMGVLRTDMLNVDSQTLQFCVLNYLIITCWYWNVGYGCVLVLCGLCLDGWLCNI